MTNKLPQGWVECKLGDIVEYKKGKKPKVLQAEYSEGLLPYVDIKCFEKNIIENYTNSDDGVLIDNKNILVVWDGARAGFCGSYNNRGILGSTIMALSPLLVNKKLIEYFIQSKFQILNKQTKGTGIPHVKPDLFWNFLFKLAPLNEQKRIVEKIEEEFGKIDEGVEKLKLAQEQIKQYRQSVLKSAFDGKLYKTTEWGNVAIKDVADVGTGATPLKSNSKYYGGNIAWVTSGELNNNFVTTASDYITDLAVKETNVTVYPIHTLLIAMYGEGKTRGKCSELLIEAGTNQAIAAIQITNEKVNREYLKKYCLYNYNNIRLQSMGGVQPNLNLTKIKNILFPLPTLDEQKQIVKEIEKRFEVADELKELLQKTWQKQSNSNNLYSKKRLKVALSHKTQPTNPLPNS